MNIAIVGYGKMGKAVEQLAKQRGHKISAVIGSENNSAINDLDRKTTDIAIEFSSPDTAVKNLTTLLKKEIPVVCGTTGWSNKISDIEKICADNNGAFLYASNFSIGVNIFFEINSLLARIISPYEEYQCKIDEIHHTQKKDTPSGTAITLADQINDVSNKYNKWILSGQSKDDSSLIIHSQRISDTIGTHIVNYRSEIDTISIKHEAHNRSGFALGSIIAAEWLQHKKGCFRMKDVLFSAQNEQG